MPRKWTSHLKEDCLCVCERERQTERQIDRPRERQRKTEIDRQREREREGGLIKSEIEKKRRRLSVRGGDRQCETGTE